MYDNLMHAYFNGGFISAYIPNIHCVSVCGASVTGYLL